MASGYPRARGALQRAARTPAAAALAGAAALAAITLGASALGAIRPGGSAQPGLLWVPDRDRNADLRRLSRELERTGGGPESAARRYALIAEIARTLRGGGEGGRERTFLALRAQRHPRDPYNTAYLVTAADSYREAGQTPLAVHYYRRALRNHPDLEVRGRSLHRLCLERLVELDGPARRVEYYRELIERFPGRIDLALALYRLAGAYAERGEWPAAFDAYQAFLDAPPTEVPGEPRAYRRAAELVRFHHAGKSWIRPDLPSLVAEAQAAVARRDVAALRRLQAGVNFFATSWGSDATLTGRFRLEAFPMRRVRAAAQLHPDSNRREAFLRTTGWTSRVATWYLYFRRIDYPVDPRVDGSWEWAGIYFGEKL